jgi:hypothetical protein
VRSDWASKISSTALRTIGLNSRTSHPVGENGASKVGSSAVALRCRAAFGPLAQYVRPRRHRGAGAAYRPAMPQRFNTGQVLMNLPTAASGARPEASHTPSGPLMMLMANTLTRRAMLGIMVMTMVIERGVFL